MRKKGLRNFLILCKVSFYPVAPRRRFLRIRESCKPFQDTYVDILKMLPVHLARITQRERTEYSHNLHTRTLSSVYIDR